MPYDSMQKLIPLIDINFVVIIYESTHAQLTKEEQ